VGVLIVSSEKKSWQAFVEPFHILGWTAEVDGVYGQTFRYLQTNGLLIGSNDIWIAATALAYHCPLVTANSTRFQRVPNLEVMAYRGRRAEKHQTTDLNGTQLSVI